MTHPLVTLRPLRGRRVEIVRASSDPRHLRDPETVRGTLILADAAGATVRTILGDIVTVPATAILSAWEVAP